jgi:hypothetical protein
LRIFKTKWFARFARKEGIDDNKLLETVTEAEKSVSVIDLGGGLIKKRVPRSGQGKSGGYRTIIVYRVKTLAIFVYGFPKTAKANLTAIELDAYKKLAQVFLGFSDQDIAKALNAGELMEVDTHDQEIQK